MHGKLVILSIALLAAFILGGCTVFFLDEGDDLTYGRVVRIETTAYCPCGVCCSWKLDKYGRAVISAGRDRGKPKAVGITASVSRPSSTAPPGCAANAIDQPRPLQLQKNLD